MRFRDAGEDDIDAVVALVDSAYRGDASRAGWTTEADLLGGQRTDVAAIADLIAASDSRIRLAFDDAGWLYACCHLELRTDGVCYFGLFAVAPDAQGGGIGRAVLTEAERLVLEDWGASTIQMTVITQRRELIDWYVRCGYAVTGEQRDFPYGDNRFGIPKVDDLRFDVLEKSLTG